MRACRRAESDLVEILSHHYLTALELAEATGDQDLRSSLIAPLLRNLELAGRRAMVLDVVAAERYFSRAMELARMMPKGPGCSPSGRSRSPTQDATERRFRPSRRRSLRLRAAGDRRNAAEALLNLGFSCMDMGLPDGAAKALEAVALVEHDEPSLEKVVVLYNGSFAEGDAGRLERALELAN